MHTATKPCVEEGCEEPRWGKYARCEKHRKDERNAKSRAKRAALRAERVENGEIQPNGRPVPPPPPNVRPLRDLDERELRIARLTERLSEEEEELDRRSSELQRRHDALLNVANELEDRRARVRVRQELVKRLTGEGAERLSAGEFSALANSLRGYLRPLEVGAEVPDIDEVVEAEEVTTIEWVAPDEAEGDAAV